MSCAMVRMLVPRRAKAARGGAGAVGGRTRARRRPAGAVASPPVGADPAVVGGESRVSAVEAWAEGAGAEGVRERRPSREFAVDGFAGDVSAVPVRPSAALLE